MGARAIGARAMVCLAALVLSSGCALHGAGRAAVRPQGAEPPDVARYLNDMRRATAAARVKQEAPVLEQQDRELQEAVQRAKQSPTVRHHRALAEAYARRGVFDAAQTEYSEALKHAPHDAASFDGRARAWRDAGFPHLGLGDAHRAVYFAPASPVYRNTLGTLLLRLGRRAEARAAFESAVARDPRAFYALNNLCYALLLEDRAPAALSMCESALALDPSSRVARNNLGLVYAAQGNHAAATREFARVGTPADTHFNLGIASMAERRFAEAAVFFDLAADAGVPNQARARARQARALALRSTEEATP